MSLLFLLRLCYYNCTINSNLEELNYYEKNIDFYRSDNDTNFK